MQAVIVVLASARLPILTSCARTIFSARKINESLPVDQGQATGNRDERKSVEMALKMEELLGILKMPDEILFI